jgi:23S rRNA (adenine2503-C2)-methyltransferase
MDSQKTNLFDLTYVELQQLLKDMKQSPFRAEQLCDWLYKKLVFDVSRMSNVSQELKDTIQERFVLDLPQIHHVSHSQADNSYKFLLQTHDGKLIESILMLDDGRASVCVSCMIGCPLACKFCATGSQIGFIRRLSPGEIVGQVLMALRYAREQEHADRITNIVFMGMGEPMLNKEAVEIAIENLTNPRCFALSPSKISVSTAGVGAGLAEFIEKTGVRLAVSLHFPTDELRLQYMPVNKRMPLKELIAELGQVKLKPRDYIFIEYLMLRGVNDSLAQAKQLLSLVGNLKVKINLIPYNPTVTLPAQASSEEIINNFAKYLQDKGLFVSVRRSKGVDVDGGCGQFALKKR